MARGKKEIKQKKIKAIQENGVVSDKTYPLNIKRMTFFLILPDIVQQQWQVWSH